MRKIKTCNAMENNWFVVSHLEYNGPTVVFWIKGNISGRWTGVVLMEHIDKNGSKTRKKQYYSN